MFINTVFFLIEYALMAGDISIDLAVLLMEFLVELVLCLKKISFCAVI